MNYSNLQDAIECITQGTKLHVGVFFLKNFKNKKCALQTKNTVHASTACYYFKNNANEKCFRCRNFVFKKAINKKQAFAGVCIHGIYEYTRPILMNNEVIGIIFIGNILTEEGRKKLCKNYAKAASFFDGMEMNIQYDECDRIGNFLESYIHFLFEKYPLNNEKINPLIENIKNYIRENIEYGFSIKTLAAFFHYNENYLAKLFKKETGKTIKEYANLLRMEKAEELLRKTNINIIEISQQCGFNNVSYFNHSFKNSFHSSPSTYRKNHS